MSNRRLPAEWEPQSGIMLTWPHENTDWAPILPKVEPTFAEIAAQTSQHEKVLIVAFDKEHQTHIADRIAAKQSIMQNIIFAIAQSNDSWARDHGPITVTDESNKPLLLDFQFNAWGDKYAFELDNRISQTLAEQQCFAPNLQSVNFILEGGSIESDGAGTLLTTDCLLSGQRNIGWTQQQIETELKNQFNLAQVHWLHQGYLQGDDTDAHIDTLARFISKDQIMFVTCDSKNDPHLDSLLAMEQELKSLRTLDGNAYELIPLPLPDPVFNISGERLPATYANFLIINNAVLVPVYQQAKDDQVIDRFKSYFENREIIPINCLPLIEQFGSLHCVTMQFPAGVLNSEN